MPGRHGPSYDPANELPQVDLILRSGRSLAAPRWIDLCPSRASLRIEVLSSVLACQWSLALRSWRAFDFQASHVACVLAAQPTHRLIECILRVQWTYLL